MRISDWSSDVCSSDLNIEDYFLPSGTVTWEATDNLQLRISASKTIARPQFRELVEQLYFDPESNRQFRGNPFLVDSKLKIGRASCREACGSTCRYRWSPYP